MHAYWALNRIHWNFHENYFPKFAARGMMDLAFKYPLHFDKQESNAGLNVFPRAELKSIYHLAPTVPMPNLEAILQLPLPVIKAIPVTPKIPASAVYISKEKAMTYFIMIAHRYDRLPTVIPVTGKPTVKRNTIKAFDSFTSGIHKATTIHLSNEQKAFHEKCLALFKCTEKIGGELLADGLFSKHLVMLTRVFNDWLQVYENLLTQPFVFAHVLFRPKQLLTRPNRNYWRKVTLSRGIPVLSFVLADRGDHYCFTMQAHVDGVLLENLSTDTPLFVAQRYERFFRLSSLRDACLVEWLNRSGDKIIIFKEHFSLFEKEVLAPLQTCYTVSVVKQ